MAHGRIVIDTERCKGCELCKSACPKDVIKLADSLNNLGHRSAIQIRSVWQGRNTGMCHNPMDGQLHLYTTRYQ